MLFITDQHRSSQHAFYFLNDGIDQWTYQFLLLHYVENLYMPWIITSGFVIVFRADDRSRLTRKLHGKSHWMKQ